MFWTCHDSLSDETKSVFLKCCIGLLQKQSYFLLKTWYFTNSEVTQ